MTTRFPNSPLSPGAERSLILLVDSMVNWRYDELAEAHLAYSGSNTYWAAVIVEAAENEMARRDANCEELHEIETWAIDWS